MITFLELKNKILSDNDNLKYLEDFILPTTDIDMLVLLIIVNKDGLDLKHVDISKFLESNSSELMIEPLDEFAPSGNQFLNISLDHILKEGYSYTFKDVFDVFGPNALVNGQVFILELQMEFENSLNVYIKYASDDIKTLGQLLDHLNNNQEEIKTVKNRPFWKFWA